MREEGRSVHSETHSQVQQSFDGFNAIKEPRKIDESYHFHGPALQRYREFIEKLKVNFQQRTSSIHDVLLPEEDRDLLLQLFQFHMNNVGNPDGQCRYGLCTRGFELKLLNSLFNYLNIKPYGVKDDSEIFSSQGKTFQEQQSFGYFTLGEKEASIWMMRTAKAMYPDLDLCLLPTVGTPVAVHEAAELLQIQIQPVLSEQESIASQLRDLKGRAVILSVALSGELESAAHQALRTLITELRFHVPSSFVHLSTASALDLLRFGEGYPLFHPDANKYFTSASLPRHLKFDSSGEFYLDSVSISNSNSPKSSFKSGVLISTIKHKKIFNNESISYINADDSTVVGSSNGDFILLDDYFYTRFPIMTLAQIKNLNREELRQEFIQRQLSSYQRDILNNFLTYMKQVQPHALGYPVNQLWDDRSLNELFELMIKEKILLNTENDHVQNDFNLETCLDGTGESYIDGFIEDVLIFYKAMLFPHDQEGFDGYITTGGTEGNYAGLSLAKRVLGSGTVLFLTEESHYSLKKSAKIFNISTCWVKSKQDCSGSMDANHFAYCLRQMRKNDPNLKPLVNVNLGTTFKGAVDHLGQLNAVLMSLQFDPDHIWFHGDAALQGHMLPFLPQASELMPFTLRRDDPRFVPLHSISLSAHKFLGAPFPCGVVLYQRCASERALEQSEEILSQDVPLLGYTRPGYFQVHGSITSGTKNPYMAVVIWKRVQELGMDGLRDFSLNSLALSEYAEQQLIKHQQETGVRVFRHDHSNILTLSPPPSQRNMDKYGLPTEPSDQGEISHFVVMPHVSKSVIDAFIQDLIDDPSLFEHHMI